MAESPGFTEAAMELRAAVGPAADLCSPFLRALDVTGAAISTLGDPLGSQTVCASDDAAAYLDEIQLDLGEGPCWSAMVSHRPVLEPDVQAHAEEGWPVALTALRETGIGGVFAFPLAIGPTAFGAVDLYTSMARVLTRDQVGEAAALATIAARQVFRRALAEIDPEGKVPSESGPYSRREVHQATGMVSVQLSIDVADALVVLRAHAFASGQSVREVAGAVVSREINFAA